MMTIRPATLCPSLRSRVNSAKNLFVLSAAVLLGGCASNPDPELVETPVRHAPQEGAVAPGNCAEALRRARLKSDLVVDRLPSPRTKVEASLRDKSMPTAVRRAKYNSVTVTVLVDTMGKADMRTFSVVKTTHPWLANRLKSALPRTIFEPARLAGCKVPRTWLGEYTAGTPPKAAASPK